MLVLLCVQVVQTNNNEFGWKLVKKVEFFNQKYLIDKIHKLIVKELKLNVNCHIKKR
jgi:hypothetical protein